MSVRPSLLVRSLLFVAAITLIMTTAAHSLDTPILVSVTNMSSSQFDHKQIVRTSTGKLYYIVGNASTGGFWLGWIDVYSSLDGANWSLANYRQLWIANDGMSIAIDSNNVIHLVSYDTSGYSHPSYARFNTIDSDKKNNSWETPELLDADLSGSGKCEIAVDANDVPHIIFSLSERYKGKSYATLYYANKVNGVWNKTSIWPKENQQSFYGVVKLAVGPDNAPYILMGTKVLKGNANNPTAFETKDLGGGNALVIHRNGDVRVALTANGKYAHYIHDHTQPWNEGWSLQDSGAVIGVSVLMLDNDMPYGIWLTPEGLWLQKWFETPFLVATAPPGHTFYNPSTRWSFYNHHTEGLIDIGVMSYTSGSGQNCWHIKHFASLNADFTASPTRGLGPLAVAFTDRIPVPEGISIVSWEWDFDNNGEVDSVLQNPTYTYVTPGKYAVRLTVTDSHGSVSTKTKPDYIEVALDIDGDAIYDSDDNCPTIYNPLQTDLDHDRIGDACDTYTDLIQEAVFNAGLRKETTSVSGGSDVAAIMTDGSFSQSQRIQKGKRGYDVLSFRSNVESSSLASCQMKLYVNALYGDMPQTAHIYAYNADGLSVQTVSLLNFTLSAGWNTLDLKPLLKYMNGFGFMKLRVAAPANWIDISEGWIEAEATDPWEVSISPSPLDFGRVETIRSATRTFTVKNTGAGNLLIEMIPAPPAPFSVTADDCSGKKIASSASCAVQVNFAPTTEGTFDFTLKIPTNDADHSDAGVNLTGTAVLPAALTGVVSDASTGLPLQNVAVTVALTKPASSNPDDLRATWGNVAAESYDSDADLAHGFTSADYQAAASNDGEKTACTGIDSGVSTCLFLFKTKNPYNTADHIKLAWNGDGGYMKDEAYAQSFVPAASGKLTKVSLTMNIDGGWNMLGGVTVFLKSGLGGESDSILAQSNVVFIGNVPITATWIDFTFATPADVVSGKTYYLELHNNGGYLVSETMMQRAGVFWSYNAPNSYSRGRGYLRNSAIWQTRIQGITDITDWTFLFKTYVDDKIDQNVSTGCCYNISMNGIETQHVGLEIYNKKRGVWTSMQWKQHAWGYDDLTLEGLTGDTTAEFYDADGWVSARARNYSYNIPALATDLFRAEFLETHTLQTDAAGRFAVYDLVPSPYTVQFAKLDYGVQTMTGTLTSGQTQTANVQLTTLPPAVLNGTVRDGYTNAPLANVSVSVTDRAGDHATVTDANGFYSAANLKEGTITAMFRLQGYVERTITETVVAGIIKNLDIYLMHPELILTIRSPENYSVVHASPVTITGSVNNNATVKIDGYNVPVINGNFSFDVGLTEGRQSAIPVSAVDQYGQSISQYVWVTLITKGTVTGIVTDSVTGVPVESATVTVTDSLNVTGTASTDTSGRFTIGGLAAGDFSGKITKSDYNMYTFTGTIDPGQILNINPTITPSSPSISSVTTGNVTSDSITITWTTDQATDSLVSYGTTTAYGSAISDPMMTTNHAITITNLAPETEYHFIVTSKNSKGLTVSSSDNTFTTSGPITVTITSPADFATLSRPDIMVKGPITNTTGNETGVTVNGIVANIYGNEFVANHVPLVEGANTITVTATDIAGYTATAAVTVNATMSGHYIRLTSNIESGISPLEVTLSVDGTFSISSSTLSVSGPVQPEVISSTIDQYKVRMTTEGRYTLTASSNGPDGNTYQDTVIITVMNKTLLDSLLKNKWEGMKAALVAGNIDEATANFTASTQGIYRDQFAALQSVLPDIVNELNGATLNMVSVQKGVTEYKLVVIRESTSFSFCLKFVNEEDGIWKIWSY